MLRISGGSVRSSDEAPVMGVERRGWRTQNNFICKPIAILLWGLAYGISQFFTEEYEEPYESRGSRTVLPPKRDKLWEV